MNHACFDPELIARYDVPGPRYTSYPTAPQFTPSFHEDDYRRHVHASNESGAPLSLYVHIPFCATVCFYCGCNKIVTKRHERAAPYLQGLTTEIARQGALFDHRRTVWQLHFGGGTPTFIDHNEMAGLMEALHDNFRLCGGDSGDYSIEIDPRTVDAQRITQLRALGFNRLSLGVQDFDATVQQAVNRIQSEAQTLAIIDAARTAGFRSINIDLIYGLPHQTMASFAATLDKIVALRPERLSVFNYAHLPQRFPPQRRILAADLPSAALKLRILHLTMEKLTATGYVYIGMDHFALPSDPLAQAQARGTLHRNFQGYTTHGECDLAGLGLSAIGSVGRCYAQNTTHLETYLESLSHDKLPIVHGLTLTTDDRLRRDIIMQLICNFRLDRHDIERRYGIVFQDYFDAELRALTALANDGLVVSDKDTITITPLGKFLVRNVCMVFDAYLNTGTQHRYSRVV